MRSWSATRRTARCTGSSRTVRSWRRCSAARMSAHSARWPTVTCTRSQARSPSWMPPGSCATAGSPIWSSSTPAGSRPGCSRPWTSPGCSPGARPEACHPAHWVEAMTALGIALIAVALALLLAEAHLSSGGLIGSVACAAAIGGVVLLLLAAGASAAVVLIVALCAAAAASLLLFTRRRILLSQKRRPRTGAEALAGHVGVVRSIGDHEAHVFLDG